jgi:heat shock protein 5
MYVSQPFISDWNLYSTGSRIGNKSFASGSFLSNPTNNMGFDAKLLLDHTFDELKVKRDLRHLPFVVKEKNGAPVISVPYEGKIREFVGSICSTFYRSDQFILL